MYRRAEEEGGEKDHGRRTAGGLLRCGDNRGSGGGVRSGVESEIDLLSEGDSL